MSALRKGSAATVMLLVAETLAAQNSCLNSTTADFLTLAFSDDVANAEAVEANLSGALERAPEAAANLPTAASISGASSASTIANLLPLFSMSGLAGDLMGEPGNAAGSDDALAFDFNTSFGRSGNSGREFKLQVAFDRDPMVLDALVESLPADQRDAFRTSAQQDLTLTDDATFSITYNVQNRALGRNRRLLGDIFNAALGGVSSDELQTQFAEMDRVVSTVPSDQLNTLIQDLNLPDAERQSLCNELTAAADAVRAAAASMNEAENLAVNDIAIETFGKLIHNQPQFYAKASFRERNSFIGADETSISINFEWGYGANVNRAQRFIDAQCGQNAAGTCLVDGFQRYITENREAIDAGDRLKFSLEYSDIDALEVMLESPAATFTKPAASKLTASFAYGRSLPVESGLFDSSRIDIEIKREDIDDDPDRNNRTIGIVTLTRSMGDLAFPFSIVYANKPEFLTGMVDSEISANIGIKYDFNDEDN